MAKAAPTKAALALQELRKVADEVAERASILSGRRAADARQQISQIIEELARVAVDLDPVREPTSIFDPANPRTVGRFIGIALVAQDQHPLAGVASFYGSGVYALYYTGPFGPYQPLVATENPIYVGKADPANPAAKTPREQAQRLSGRLKDHARSIGKAATTLAREHFRCRYLVVQTGWQGAAENYLINLFKPVWNDEIGLCYGVGKHGDDPQTRANLRSPWDTLHPGRAWAHRSPAIRDAKPKTQILAEMEAHFRVHPPFQSVEAILKQFFDDLRQR